MYSDNNQDNDCYAKEHQGGNQASDNEEYGYEIYNTTNENNQRYESSGNNLKHSNNPISTETDQFEQLKHKISSQAKRLTELQIYKALCERHILQLSPGHSLPITDNDLIQHEKDPAYFEQSQAIGRLLMEKEQTLASLRNETLVNEEQRNYIEILKQTIESAIIKNGLGPSLQKCQSSLQGQNNLDVIIDFTKLKGENEKMRKDLIMEQVILTDMKSELEAFKKQAEDLEVMNKQLKEILNKEKAEKSDLCKQLNQLDKSKSNLLSEREITIKDNKTLKTNLSEHQSLNKQYEKELLEKKRDVTTLNAAINDLTPFKAKYNDLSSQYHELQLKFTEISKYSKDMERANEKLKIDLDLQQSSAKKLTQLIEDNNQSHQNEKQNLLHENNTLLTALKQAENEHMELSNDLMQKANEIKRLKEKEKDLNQTHSTLTDTQNALSEYKASTEAKLKALTKSLRESQIETDQLKYLSNNLQIDLNAKEKEVIIMQSDMLKAQSEISLLKRDNSKKGSSIKELSNQVNKKISENEMKAEEVSHIHTQSLSLEKELSFWKDKYDQDIYAKTQEVNSLRREVNELNFKIEDINKSYNRVLNDNTLKNEEIVRGDEREKKLLSEFKQLKELNNELNSTLDKNLLNLKAEIKKAFELNSANTVQALQIRDLRVSCDKLKEDHSKKEDFIKGQSAELLKLKCLDKENEIKFYSLSTSYTLLTKMIMSSYNTIQEFVSKFKDIFEDNRELSLQENPMSSYYSISFQEFVNENGANCESEGDYMRNIERFISVITTEVEILYEHIKSMSSYNEEIEKKMASLEQSETVQETEKEDQCREQSNKVEKRNVNHVTTGTIPIHENNQTNPTIFNDYMTPLITKDNHRRAKDYETESNEKRGVEVLKEEELYAEYNQRVESRDPSQAQAIREQEVNSHLISSSFSGVNKQMELLDPMNHQNTIPMSNYLINSNNPKYTHTNYSSNTLSKHKNVHSKTYELIYDYNKPLHNDNIQSPLQTHDSYRNKTVFNNKNYSFSNSSLTHH